ncbi:MAG: alpha/beta fold hydrolase [Clostridia bacterium]|nr:alpha/beta fold hydrolase [Clostridia bacterium]
MHKYFEINAKGSNIRCKLYHGAERTADKAIIFCTGFAGHKDNGAAQKFADMALSRKDTIVVVFNWPAHGDDVKKKLTLEDCDAYLGLVIQEVRAKYGVRELYAYATSFGGYLVLKYISEHENPFRRIALRCPAVCMYDVLTRSIMKNDELDRLAKGKDVLVGFDRKITVTHSLLEDIKANDIRQRDYLECAEDILILHGTADEIVPFEESQAFAENNLIEFIPVPGADHRFQNPAHMSLANKSAMAFFGLQ